MCFQEVLKSLLQSNPQPYWYLQQQGQGGSGRGFYSGYGASRQREGDQEMQVGPGYAVLGTAWCKVLGCYCLCGCAACWPLVALPPWLV